MQDWTSLKEGMGRKTVWLEGLSVTFLISSPTEVNICPLLLSVFMAVT